MSTPFESPTFHPKPNLEQALQHHCASYWSVSGASRYPVVRPGSKRRSPSCCMVRCLRSTDLGNLGPLPLPKQLKRDLHARDLSRLSLLTHRARPRTSTAQETWGKKPGPGSPPLRVSELSVMRLSRPAKAVTMSNQPSGGGVCVYASDRRPIMSAGSSRPGTWWPGQGPRRVNRCLCDHEIFPHRHSVWVWFSPRSS